MKSINTFANTGETPAFDTAGIVRRTHRKRITAVIGVATTLILAGGGSALATTAVTDSAHTAKAAAVSKADVATLLYRDGKVVIPLQLGGWSWSLASEQFVKAQLKPDVTKTACHGSKPGTVVSISPHAPTVVSRGATVKVFLCEG